MTTVHTLIRDTANILNRAGIDESRLEAELLWMTVLQTDRTSLYANLDYIADDKAAKYAHELISRRLKREPLAYLRKARDFFGLRFYVASGVLIPRPETEILVETALSVLEKRSLNGLNSSVVDIGTGSGAIAISLAVNFGKAVIFATDISSQALDIARFNAMEHYVSERIEFLKGDLVDPIYQPVDLLIANLPYVKSRNIQNLQPEIRLYEPQEALDGGENGLFLIERLLLRAPDIVNQQGSILLEMDPDQVDLVRTIALKVFPDAEIEILRDLAGFDRVMFINQI